VGTREVPGRCDEALSASRRASAGQTGRVHQTAIRKGRIRMRRLGDPEAPFSPASGASSARSGADLPLPSGLGKARVAESADAPDLGCGEPRHGESAAVGFRRPELAVINPKCSGRPDESASVGSGWVAGG
jgi:hypothetical protein